MSPNISFGESLIQFAYVQTCICAQYLPWGDYLHRNRAQYGPDVLSLKIIAHPVSRLWSNSFVAPFYLLVFAPSIWVAATTYTYPRSRYRGRFGCEAISPNSSSGESLIQCPLLHNTRIRAQERWSVTMKFCNFDYLQASALKTSRIYKYSRSRPLEHSAVDNISHPAFRVGSHSFDMPCSIPVLTLERVDRLAVKIIFHPAVRLGNHSFNVPYYVLVLVLN